MRRVLEEEKLIMEKRHLDEKNKLTKKLNLLTDEYEDRIREEKLNLEEEIENLRENFSHKLFFFYFIKLNI